MRTPCLHNPTCRHTQGHTSTSPARRCVRDRSNRTEAMETKRQRRCKREGLFPGRFHDHGPFPALLLLPPARPPHNYIPGSRFASTSPLLGQRASVGSPVLVKLELWRILMRGRCPARRGRTLLSQDVPCHCFHPLHPAPCSLPLQKSAESTASLHALVLTRPVRGRSSGTR